MLKNTKEAFLEMKNVVQSSKESDSVLNNTTIAICFLLAIEQKEYKYAYELISKITKWNPTLIFNLKAIALCKLGRIHEAFFCMETILIELKHLDDVSGIFFPLTVNNLIRFLFPLSYIFFNLSF